MKLNWKYFMDRESAVVDCLMKEHHLEQDTVLKLILEHGDELRESTLCGYEPDAIANQIASYVSK
jgi:hypothetical protein